MMNYTIMTSVLLCCAVNISLASSSKTIRLDYIEANKYIAIAEMERTGVPASIKLAQALLESNAGQSTLAVQANNHFGIKCGGEWKGKKIFRKDDDYRRGKLVKSCFRSYKYKDDSFIAHSEFLMKHSRYDFLFHYDLTDYKSWARGLKKAGYATDPNYPRALIKIIEDYRLYEFDEGLARPLASTRREQVEPDRTVAPREYSIAERQEAQGFMLNESVSIEAFSKMEEEAEYHMVNGLKVVSAKSGDTPVLIANKMNVKPAKLLKYNNNLTKITEYLEEGQRVFLQAKRKKFTGKKKFHYLREGESMANLSDQYGIDLTSLYKLNKLPLYSEPEYGEKIRLKGKPGKSRIPRIRPYKMDEEKTVTASLATMESNVNPAQTVNISDSSEELEQDVTSVSAVADLLPPTTIETPTVNALEKEKIEFFTTAYTAKDEIKAREEDKVETVQHIAELQTPSGDDVEHVAPITTYITVVSGDTLYSIAKRNGVSVNDLKNWNNLIDNTIKIGQSLRVR